METMFYSASVSILSWDLKGATAVKGQRRVGQAGKFSYSSQT